MSPLRSYPGWNTRPSDSQKQIDPYKKYYFICEGQNTERWYFEKFIDMRKDFSISSMIEMKYLEKTGNYTGWSNPKNLLQLSEEVRKSKDYDFDPKRDVIVVVFDADIYEEDKEAEYKELIEKAEKENTICVTNPSFELFLLLHYENSYNEIILPNSDDILKNNWVTSNDGDVVRCIEEKLRQKSGLRPKKDEKGVVCLVKNVKVAIEQEKSLNNDIHHCMGNLTSNVGSVLQQILSDTYIPG